MEQKKNISNYELQVDIGKQIFLKYDQQLLIRKYRLEADAQYLYLTYLNTPCRIHRASGSVEEQYPEGWKECREFSRVMTIYDLLCYHKGEAAPELSHRWCAVGNFVITGVTQTETFTKEYARLFDGDPEAFKVACQKLGGTLQMPMAGADITCKFQVTPFFPVLLQFWAGDEEFPPRLLILWDSHADQFLHFETTFYLQEDLLSWLKSYVDGSGK